MVEKVQKPEKPVWWTFFRIGADGWSSEYLSADLLLEHLKRKGGSVASRRAYCYNLCRIFQLVEKILKNDIADLDLRIRADLLKKMRSTAKRLKVDKIDPDNFIRMIKKNPDALCRVIQLIADKQNDLKSVRYANHIIAVAKTFFKVNKVEFDLKGYTQHTRSRKRQEYIPSLNEALKMADVAGSLRDRLFILFLTYTGLRNSTLRALVYNEAYPDPLLQEYTIKKQLGRAEEFLAIVVDEVMKKRIPNACKNKISYYTFISPKVTECLRLYLREMEEKYAEEYGAMRDDQPIFHTENRRLPLDERLRTHISARELEEIVKNAAKRAGITNWKLVYPHCLRKTYESLLRNQPDDVRLDVKDREFLFGHTMPGSQDTYYDKTKIEEMRAKYSKMIFEPVSLKTEERVVSEDELQTFLQQGWRFVATLPSGKVVVSREVKVERPEDAKTVSVQTSNAMVQKDKTQSNPKMRISESFAPSVEAHDSSEGRAACATESRQPGSPELTNPSTIAIPQHDPQNSPSVMQSTNTQEEKDAQGSITKYGQKTLLDFNS